jgi:hypothetical protein
MLAVCGGCSTGQDSSRVPGLLHSTPRTLSSATLTIPYTQRHAAHHTAHSTPLTTHADRNTWHRTWHTRIKSSSNETLTAGPSGTSSLDTHTSPRGPGAVPCSTFPCPHSPKHAQPVHLKGSRPKQVSCCQPSCLANTLNTLTQHARQQLGPVAPRPAGSCTSQPSPAALLLCTQQTQPAEASFLKGKETLQISLAACCSSRGSRRRACTGGQQRRG